ncbi:MAG: rRNA maturation RNase YbeY [Myxococcaceae bacterium]|jgi:probable rRNA maturation factor|nr:rRNA maturation RNase YbeY [Myxococcaceae bacterium]
MARRRSANKVWLDSSRGGAGADARGDRLVRRSARFFKVLKLAGVELSLSLVRDAEIRQLNALWRRKDEATDVLSFPAGEMPGPGRRVLGDVVISLETARRAAKAFGTTLDDELDLYLAHGLLHLLGYEHHTRPAAREMEALERKLLGRPSMLSRSDEL